MDKNKRARNWQFTINNYTKKNLKQLQTVSETLEKHNYICYGLEIAPDTGTKHIQGYIQLTNAMTFQALQKYLALTKKEKLVKFHCEIARKSAKINILYTSKTRKEDLEPNEIWLQYGEPKQQGARSDLSELKEKIFSDPKSGSTIIENQDISYQQIKYIELVQKYAFKHRHPNKPPKVIWIWGDSGTGKTAKIFKDFETDDIFSLTDYNWLGEGYTQQSVYLIDDFRQHDIKFNMLIKLLDRYPFTLSVKGSSIPLNSEYIIITSNQSINETFGSPLNFFEDLEQLRRRVNEFNILELENKKIQELILPNYKK